MKATLLLVVLTLTSIKVVSQEFIIVDSDLQWQWVVEGDVGIEQYYGFIRTGGHFSSADTTRGVLTGELKWSHARFKELGYSEWTVPMYVARQDVKGYVVVEFKKSKYRITVKNIRLKQTYTDPLSEEGEESPLIDYALTSYKTIKKGFLKKPAKIYEHTFRKLLEYQEPSQDDW